MSSEISQWYLEYSDAFSVVWHLGLKPPSIQCCCYIASIVKSSLFAERFVLSTRGGIVRICSEKKSPLLLSDTGSILAGATDESLSFEHVNCQQTILFHCGCFVAICSSSPWFQGMLDDKHLLALYRSAPPKCSREAVEAKQVPSLPSSILMHYITLLVSKILLAFILR